MEKEMRRQFAPVAEVAEILAVTPQHIYNMCKTGNIPSIRLGNKWLIPVSFLEVLRTSNSENGRS